MMVASELFPLQVRGFALGVATLVNRTTSGLVALSFLSPLSRPDPGWRLLSLRGAGAACVRLPCDARARDHWQVARGD